MDQQHRTTGKRKAVRSAGEAAAMHNNDHYPDLSTPRYISIKLRRVSDDIAPSTTMTIPRTGETDQPKQPCFASLQLELFYNVVAYLGPTSSSLSTLSQVSREHRSIMTSIGDVMLHRAKLRFRTPMPPKSDCESSISLFVRHARASKVVDDSLKVLDDVLKKDFPYIHTSSLHDTNKSGPYDSALLRDISGSDLTLLCSTSSDGFKGGSTNIVEPSEVNTALNTALCLLGGCPESFNNSSRACEISKYAATTALEWRVDSLCSKLGAKAYKYAKSRMCRRYEREDAMFSSYTSVTDEMVPHQDADGDDSEYDDMSIDPSELEADMDMSILDKASLVMQHVVLREQQNARRRSSREAAAIQYGVMHLPKLSHVCIGM